MAWRYGLAIYVRVTGPGWVQEHSDELSEKKSTGGGNGPRLQLFVDYNPNCRNMT